MRQSNPIEIPKELDVPFELHLKNRSKLLKQFKEQVPQITDTDVMLFEGVPTLPVDDQDIEYYAAQETNFWYLFGVMESDCFATIEIQTGKVVLFVPNIPESSKMWMVVKSQEEFKTQYHVNEVKHVEEIEPYLNALKPRKIFLYEGIDSDSKRKPRVPSFPFLNNFSLEKESLYDILNECRVVKSPDEIDVLRYVSKVSSEGHIKVLQNIRSGNKEYQIEALFRYHAMNTCGARHLPYDCICASGRNGAYLHYIVNDKTIQDNQMVLCDMGSKYYGYCADITVTFPINGKFNEKQKLIYNAVLDAQKEVYKGVRPGANWGDLHLVAERTIVKHLHEAGIVIGDLEDINNARVGSLFFPHGLGHLLGLRVHDVGGYMKGQPERIMEPGLRYLRTRRNLQPGMVLTNEPGCYFIEFIIRDAFNSEQFGKFLNREKLNEFMEVGGVRLEDDFVVTQDGYEILSDVPRTIAQVEACMKGENWKAFAE